MNNIKTQNMKTQDAKIPDTAYGTYCCPICTHDAPHAHSREYWIGVDFDGTLAFSVPNRTDPYELGEPIPAMVNRVKDWLAKGYTVKLLTARMNLHSSTGHTRDLAKMNALLEQWCQKHIGSVIECVNTKDGWMEVLWDDRAISVDKDTGHSTVVALKHRIEQLEQELELELTRASATLGNPWH
jgi:hypothetical protein